MFRMSVSPTFVPEQRTTLHCTDCRLAVLFVLAVLVVGVLPSGH